MIINRSFKDFEFRHRNKKIKLYIPQKVKDDQEILNLIDNFLDEKIVLYLNLLKRVKLKDDTLYLVRTLIKFGNLIIKTLT